MNEQERLSPARSGPSAASPLLADARERDRLRLLSMLPGRGAGLQAEGEGARYSRVPHRQDEEHGSRDHPEHVERAGAVWYGRACHGARAAVRSGAAGSERPAALLHRERQG